MTVEESIRARRWAVMIGMIIGFTVEFFLIPLPRHPEWQRGWLRTLLTSGDFYYAVVSPLAIWWWFAVFLKRRTLQLRELGMAYFIFGFYLSSAVQAIASVVFQSLHLMARV